MKYDISLLIIYIYIYIYIFDYPFTNYKIFNIKFPFIKEIIYINSFVV